MFNLSAVFQSKEVFSFLEGLAKRVEQTTKKKSKSYVGLLSAIIFRDVMAHFKNEEGPERVWPTWSVSYMKQMVAKGKGSKRLLQYDGTLRQKFKPSNVRESSDGLLWFNDAKTKSGFEYAWAHNYGGWKVNRPPKREFMWASRSALDDIDTQTLNFLMDD